MDHTSVSDPVGTISERAKRLRRRKDWTAAELGQRMSDLGIPWDRSIVANLENGRRKSVSVAELLGLSLALDVAPIHLLVSPEGGRYQPVPLAEYDADTVRAWIRGERPLPGTDSRTYRSEAPEGEWVDGDLPESAQAENEVSRHLLAGVTAARHAGLDEERVIDWIRNVWQLSDRLEKGLDGEH
ncbi:helix-turn-helix transcriptional regulator [Streptomyces sp. NPDC057235]|uniref:helix-turn-helix transcriptional regulator n=1 Tax=Streptomyces sp. NPDC057235 TaxID=3346058 RepID=UPI00362E88C9